MFHRFDERRWSSRQFFSHVTKLSYKICSLDNIPVLFIKVSTGHHQHPVILSCKVKLGFLHTVQRVQGSKKGFDGLVKLLRSPLVFASNREVYSIAGRFFL